MVRCFPLISYAVKTLFSDSYLGTQSSFMPIIIDLKATFSNAMCAWNSPGVYDSNHGDEP